MKTGTNTVDPDHIHIIEDIAATVTIIPAEVSLGCTIGTTDDITEAIHDTHTQILISTVLTTTLHIEDHLHIGAHLRTHEIAADPTLDQPTGQQRKPCIRIYQIPEDPRVKHTLEEIQESP